MSSRNPAAEFLPLSNSSARAFVDKFAPYIVSVLSRMGLQAHQIDDASQETLIRALNALPKFKGGSALKTWVHRIAYNEGVRLINKQNRHATEDLRDEHQASDFERDDINLSLHRLSPDQRLALTYFYFDELSTLEISDLMGVTNSTVKSWLKRGRDSLRALQPTDISSLDIEGIKINSLMAWRHQQLPSSYFKTRKVLFALTAATVLGTLFIIDSSLYPSLSVLAVVPTILRFS